MSLFCKLPGKSLDLYGRPKFGSLIVTYPVPVQTVPQVWIDFVSASLDGKVLAISRIVHVNRLLD
ncbi:MAG: hypothetical protein O3A47_07775 [Chloroflexi bacterium]|nr:hypothetical protein [Chloroflexota bacterium]